MDTFILSLYFRSGFQNKIVEVSAGGSKSLETTECCWNSMVLVTSNIKTVKERNRVEEKRAAREVQKKNRFQ